MPCCITQLVCAKYLYTMPGAHEKFTNFTKKISWAPDDAYIWPFDYL